MDDIISKKKKKRERITTEKFISDAIALYGEGTYTYEKTKYINQNSKVTITCPKHGDFEVLAGNFRSGHGCRQCSIEKRAKGCKIPQEKFIQTCREIHNNYYIYDKTVYTGCFNLITVTCPKHGDFEIIATLHSHGGGCKKCLYERNTAEQMKPLSKFLEEAKEVWGDTYTYEKAVYVGSRKKLIVTCPKHGDFDATPTHFLKGVGCPKCKMSHGENEVRRFLERNRIDYISQKRFSDCRDKKPLPFDFYIPSLNTCIEYQGEQHYRPIPFPYHQVEPTERNIKEYEQVKRRDGIKREYCRDNNINLIEIKYNESVSKKLSSLLLTQTT